MADLTYVAPAASDAAGQVGKPAEYPNSLYPELEPFSSEHFPVGDGHELYLEQSGKADGVPCIFVHGGPGGGTSPRSRRFFDPAVYRIVVFDQRGSGKSKPNAADDLDGSLVENNTGKLVADMEAIREHLKIEQWGMVFGGSWGSTLTLAYAQAHPTRTRSVVLRGVFTFTPQEVGYLFQDGLTAGQHPAAWAMYCKYIRDTSKSPECWEQLERHDLLSAYWSRLTHKEDPAVRNAAASAFVGYELSISKTFVDPAIIEAALATPSKLIPFAVMEVLYMRNAGFMPRGALLDGVKKMVSHGHRVAIAHGRADYVCQPQAAYRLAEALRAAGHPAERLSLEFVAGAGHSDSEPGLVDALIRATDAMREHLV